MKALFCGSRTWTDVAAIESEVAKLPDDAIVITGLAQGADQIARACALERGLIVIDVPVLRKHWERWGRRAGHERNRAMLELGPDVVKAFQEDASRGTQGTIDGARKRAIPVEVFT